MMWWLFPFFHRKLKYLFINSELNFIFPILYMQDLLVVNSQLLFVLIDIFKLKLLITICKVQNII